jgi:hypothetical protein
MAYYHSCYERQEISHGQEADRGPPKADRVRRADLARAQPALARVQENVSGACRGGVPRSVAKVHTAADLKAALRESAGPLQRRVARHRRDIAGAASA